MNTNGVRAAIYLRVSRDDQTTENQRLVLAKVAGHRGWLIVQTYEDQGISGAKGRDQRPAFDTMLKDAVRRRFDILMVWSIDRLGRSVLHVAMPWPNSMLLALPSTPISRPSTHDADGTGHDPDGVGLRRAGTTDHSQPGSRRSRPGTPAGEEAGRPKVSPKIEAAIRSI